MKDTRPTATAWADGLMAFATQFYAENPGGDIPQTCFIEKANGEMIMVGCPWGSFAERAIILGALSWEIERVGAKRYAFMSEVWTVEDEASDRYNQERERRGGEFSLADFDGRLEMVAVVVAQADAPPLFLRSRLVRGEGGGVVRLEPVPVPDGVTFDGDLMNLFPREATH